MTSVLLKRSSAVKIKDVEPGHWMKPVGRQLSVLAVFRCPVCRSDSVLVQGRHSVNEQGAVSPSLVCPTLGCPFHEYVVLDNWT